MRATLCGKAAQELDNLLKTDYDNNGKVAVDFAMYVMADKDDCPVLRDHCVAYMFDYINASDAEAAVWSVVRFIKESMVDTAPLKVQLRKYLSLRLRYFVELAHFQELIQDLPDVAVQLFKQMMRDPLAAGGMMKPREIRRRDC